MQVNSPKVRDINLTTYFRAEIDANITRLHDSIAIDSSTRIDGPAQILAVDRLDRLVKP